MESKSNNQYALVTGATTGIGYELTKLLAQDGYNIIAVARNEEELKKAAADFSQYNVQVETIAKDLFNPDAATELYNELKARNTQIDILVNDAGQGVYGLFTERSLEDFEKIIALNIISLTRLTYYVLGDMLSRGSGKILQLASELSEIPSPYWAVYAATKAYVLSLSEAIHSEIKDSGVTITALQPPVTDTDFYRKAGGTNSKNYVQGKVYPPAMVAKAGYEAMLKGDDKVVPGFANKIQMAIANIMPDTMLADNLKSAAAPLDKAQ